MPIANVKKGISGTPRAGQGKSAGMMVECIPLKLGTCVFWITERIIDMRKLNATQKKALTQAVTSYCKTTGSFPMNIDELDNLNDIDNMNPNEMFWQNAERFVDDLRMSGKYDYVFHRSTPW
jgi:hypothetical protein